MAVSNIMIIESYDVPSQPSIATMTQPLTTENLREHDRNQVDEQETAQPRSLETSNDSTTGNPPSEKENSQCQLSDTKSEEDNGASPNEGENAPASAKRSSAALFHWFESDDGSWSQYNLRN